MTDLSYELPAEGKAGTLFEKRSNSHAAFVAGITRIQEQTA
ncbi:hypothetical protein [Sphingomonas rubra]|uniref:Uncharacterized protein n=1 Tax=Sphingomonas rubra TaxID=634430 RepID=A0A1I5T8R4_9SPHN|nr:hypothetical protein [Sphingomonas rubra]SFP79444.1 hypothetical protein SAMN04488241_107136 [Sphingomonas rubra]